MTDSEARAFADHPHFANALRVRHYDDLGKVEGMPTAYLEEFTALLALFVRQGD